MLWRRSHFDFDATNFSVSSPSLKVNDLSHRKTYWPSFGVRPGGVFARGFVGQDCRWSAFKWRCARGGLGVLGSRANNKNMTRAILGTALVKKPRLDLRDRGDATMIQNMTSIIGKVIIT